VALVIAFYALFVGLKLLLWWASTRYRFPRLDCPDVDDDALPKYTILVPVLHEANVVARLADALQRLRYPTDKLQILLLLEWEDCETRAALSSIHLPEHFQLLEVPADGGPRTKPKALDYGFERAVGDRLVVYDAEDRPEPDQLLKAVAAFRHAKDRRPDVACVQATLAFWNPRSSRISTFYWAEYAVHFDTVLRGLAQLGLVPPLGGTSNHFKREALEAVSRANGPWAFGSNQVEGPWDPYNITEDADLAFRLARCGYRTDMFESVTFEEAPVNVVRAKNQRSRWLQGYAQTGLVHTREPMQAIRQAGWRSFVSFNVIMLGTPLALLVNPFTWATMLLYGIARVGPFPGLSGYIESLFIGPTYYIGMILAVAGNALLFYQKLVIPLRQQERWEERLDPQRHVSYPQHELAHHLLSEEYGLTVRLVFTPFWWAFTSVSAYRALRRLLTPSQRSTWYKSAHGHAMGIEDELRLASVGAGVVP
jgi:cellulose synthase/poly-beta-1,6-N-acetylglucosamine synthase-like glycosyltransferase